MHTERKLTKIEAKKLLSDRRVIEEIKRHLWLESEKAGYDIGFDRAAEDWLENYAVAWIRYHMPKQVSPRKKTSTKASSAATPKAKAKVKKKPSTAKRRSAKTYIA
jgi:hypothetical protein